MTEPVISVHNLNKSFAHKPAVINLNLEVQKGEIYGFLGPNGSGKTTTIRLLCGLLTPDSGEGTCLGFDIKTQAQQIKANVGYMTQRFSYYEDLSVVENLDFIARLYNLPNRRDKVQSAIGELNLTNRQHQLAQHLSGGWKQRLALAACLLHDPKLLLLDEPTAGVDPKARREFWDHIHLLSERGITTLVSTHYMDEAERCTRLAYISDGVILVKGTIPEVIQSAHLTVWSVIGPDLALLAEQLRALKTVTQVVPFGQALHVSGHDGPALAKALAPFRYEKKWQWSENEANLEDVFIYYVNSRERKEA